MAPLGGSGDAHREGLRHWRSSDADEPWTSVDWCDAHAGALLAADSWRVVDGRVRGLDQHRARFLSAVAPFRDDGGAFFDEVVAALPRAGDWFPRVELRARGIPVPAVGDGPSAAGAGTGTGTVLSLRLRPTPTTTEEVVVATAPYDPRAHPLTKGPDLEALQRLRTAVQPLGAGEAIILSPDGLVVEGAYSGLVWVRSDDAMVHPDDGRARIPSVTVSVLLKAAAAHGVAIEASDARPDDLDGCELWVLSALHGLRVATAWVDGPRLVHEPGRAEGARRWLTEALVELPAVP
ncbi:aminotransferase class IV [Microcella alkalica]